MRPAAIASKKSSVARRDREDHDLRLGRLVADPPRGVQAATGHVEVEQAERRPVEAAPPRRRRRRVGLGHDREAGALQGQPDAGAGRGVVVGQHDREAVAVHVASPTGPRPRVAAAGAGRRLDGRQQRGTCCGHISPSEARRRAASSQLPAARLVVEQRADPVAEVRGVAVAGVDGRVAAQPLHLRQRELHDRLAERQVLEHLAHRGAVVHGVALVDADAHVRGREVGAHELVADAARELDDVAEAQRVDAALQGLAGVAGPDDREVDVVAAAPADDVLRRVDEALEPLLGRHHARATGRGGGGRGAAPASGATGWSRARVRAVADQEQPRRVDTPRARSRARRRARRRWSPRRRGGARSARRAGARDGRGPGARTSPRRARARSPGSRRPPRRPGAPAAARGRPAGPAACRRARGRRAARAARRARATRAGRGRRRTRERSRAAPRPGRGAAEPPDADAVDDERRALARPAAGRARDRHVEARLAQRGHLGAHARVHRDRAAPPTSTRT